MNVQTKDPVCGGAVDQTSASRRAAFEGFEYCFCSDACLGKFKSSPRQFVAPRT